MGDVPVPVDTSHPSPNHGSRDSTPVSHIVLHYTASAATAGALAWLTSAASGVSSHYLVSSESPARVYRLVDEGRSAWHAGVSSWYGTPSLNHSSVGIEVVNAGPVAGGGWQPYTEEQVDLLKRLVREVAIRHGVPPRNIVGHSDISPGRKQDPGPAFPWERLFREAGLGRWFDAGRARQGAAIDVPPMSWFRDQLARLGYLVAADSEGDAATGRVLAAFQMHYRKACYGGQRDAATAGILSALE